jgi:hypothetical protein
MKGIYRFVGCSYPSDSIVADVHSESKQKGRSVQLSREIEDLCGNLFERLQGNYKSQSVSLIGQ